MPAMMMIIPAIWVMKPFRNPLITAGMKHRISTMSTGFMYGCIRIKVQN